MGKTGLFVVGVVGGLLGTVASAAVARARRWIAPHRFRATALGTSIGLLAAAAIATNTLSSPIGPILSTLLVGVGALIGAGSSRDGI